jgi:hypothetical protein
MRFGYSPGWAGRSASGLGPCAEYLTTGQWPTAAMAAAAQGQGWGAGMAGGGFGQGQPQVVPDVAFLEAQAGLLEQQLEALRQQIAELKGND